MRYLFTIWLLIVGTNLHAQKVGRPLVDSLLAALPKASPDTTRVNILTKIGDTYASIDPDTAITYANQAMELAKSATYSKGVATAYNILGICATYKSDFKTALDNWKHALQIFKEIGYEKGALKVMGNIAAIYIYQSDYSRALEHNFEALKYAESLNDKRSIAVNLGNIGTNYHYLKEYTKSTDYYLRALKVFEELQDRPNIAIYLGNIGNEYKEQKRFAEALDYNKRALKENTSLTNNEGITRDMLNLGSILSVEGHYTEGLAYYVKAQKFSEAGNFKLMEAKAFGSIGETLLMMVKDTVQLRPAFSSLPLSIHATDYLPATIIYLKKAIDINRSIGNLIDLQLNYGNLSEAQKLSGLPAEALASKDSFIVVKDSIFSMDSRLKVTNLETKRELDLKDKQIELDRLAVAKKRNERGFFIAGIVLLLIVIGFVIRNIRLKSAKELSENKLNAFQARMNPHFIFNSLNSIQSLVLNNETINSIKYLSEFSKLMRQILDSSSKSKVLLKTEIQMLRSYIELEQLRFERFSYSINVAEDTYPDSTKIPAMIIQPFVENAIIHGILPKRENGVLTLSFTTEEERIICTIDDNGIGRERSAELNKERAKEHNSQGISIATNRLALLDKRKGNVNRVVYIDKKENGVATGTRVILQIPML